MMTHIHFTGQTTRIRRLLCLLLILTGFAPGLLAQDGGARLVGQVMDEVSGDFASGVTITLIGQNKTISSAADGTFLFSGITPGEETVSVSGAGYVTKEIAVRISSQGVTDLGVIILQPSSFDEGQSYVGELSDIEVSEDGDDQQMSTSIVFSNDVFLKKAGYRFSQFSYKIRGYDNRYQERYINGINFNDLVRGVFNYAAIGALNDLTRNGNSVNYHGESDFSFGDIGGSQNIDMCPSTYRRGGKLTLSGTNRNYYLRGMFSYTTGLMDNGWAFSGLLGGRYSHEGVVEGTFYRNLSLSLGAEKQWDGGRHSLSLVAFVSPVERGQQGASVDQAVYLVGHRNPASFWGVNEGLYSYNPNWGYQNGKKRNARVVTAWDPTAILSYSWKPDEKTDWTTGLAFHYNRYGRTGLNWYNGPDPRPDYYRYLPEYYRDSPFAKDLVTYLWQTGQVSQINWDKLYEVNDLNNRAGSGSAVYMVEERRNDLMETTLNSTFNRDLSPHVKLSAGVGYKYARAHHFKTVDDLMGAKYLLDVDKFAERDFPGDPVTIQNDLNRPGRRVWEGDVFGYDYLYRIHNADIWAQQKHTYSTVDFYYGARLGLNAVRREGLMRNGRYPDASFGKGDLHTFFTYEGKGGVTYKIDGRHFLSANASIQSRPQLADDFYVSPDITDAVVSDLKPSMDANVDLNYVFSTPQFTGRVSLFQTWFWNNMDKVAYYNDLQSTFILHTLYDMNKIHRGVELGVNYAVTSALNLDFIGTFSEYYFSNNPMGVMNSTNGKVVNLEEEVLMKDLYVGGVPQAVGTFGINYFIDYWFLSANFNAFGRNHISPAPIRRLKSNYTGIVPEDQIALLPAGAARDDAQKKYDAFKEMTTQERFAPGFTIDLSVGKIFYLPGRRQVNFNFSVQNLLNRRDYITGGFEQGRINFLTPWNFGNKYYYMQGVNFFLNASYLF